MVGYPRIPSTSDSVDAKRKTLKASKKNCTNIFEGLVQILVMQVA